MIQDNLPSQIKAHYYSKHTIVFIEHYTSFGPFVKIRIFKGNLYPKSTPE